MCQSRSSRKIVIDGKPKRVDKCLAEAITFINSKTDMRTLGSCCGHLRYPLTIVVRSPHGNIFEFISQKEIPRKKRFYVKDKDGFFFIPETINGAKSGQITPD
jgi:hypothetical protein